MGEPAKDLPRIEIYEKYCKGCALCVDFCPTDVLVMKGAYAVVKDLEKCTRCNICDDKCPDFAIQVFD